ncbi:DUF4145 domain-containing protein [Chryseobacterium sp. MDT2-18]|uniref:DUF4145 domain-containing protein n=1 Tax=Chryseobacterium sp. MDT2-18 TaxID=1259136 RepID=UPI002789D034|nr:DUF4145 domain-containing protein [Chryseobacterium sp. MDT2-18]MDQ0477095.1 hypothetical protein [Chryseobacterium sp. MDT2-18]
MTDYDRAFKILAERQKIYASLFEYPNECPYCHKTIIPEFLHDYLDTENVDIYASLLCPNSDCNMPFIAKYEGQSSTVFQYKKLIKITQKKENFSSEIDKVSPKFIEIYNEAYFAEQHELYEICGVAYRKALEFLLKDYLILKNPEKRENIINSTIANCINTYIDDTRLKSTANRAIWLGNDHTHYEKKWETKDLSDLKTLIRLTVNWIETEILTSQYTEDMKK